MKDIQNAIEVNHITKSFKVFLDKGNTLKEVALFSRRRKYENRVVLDDISFTVKKGETVALIGHNGCGKSTTLKMLTRIMYPDSGTIEMAGRVSSLIELGAGFHPDMSGRENIYINASIFGLTKKEIDDRLQDIVEFSELEEFIDNPVRTYSSGMYMRLAFAVAINVNADILLIDEILAVGDANFQSKCFERMKELKGSGVTIVIVTHDSNTVRTFCDRAIWINEGHVVEMGNSSVVVDKYLEYMNEARLKQAEKEKEKEKEAEKKEESATHFGNGKAVIVSCDILNSKREVVNALRADEKYYLRIHYKVNDPSAKFVFGMGIYTLDRLWIFGTNNLLRGDDLEIKDEGIVEAECEPLNLFQGKYILQCSIVEDNQTPCDFYSEYCRFTVVNNIRESGLIHYDTSWYTAETEQEEKKK